MHNKKRRINVRINKLYLISSYVGVFAETWESCYTRMSLLLELHNILGKTKNAREC